MNNVVNYQVDGHYFVIQGDFTVDPDQPRWANILKLAVNGWESIDNSHGRLQGYRFNRFWSDFLGWDHQEDAKAAFRIVRA